MYNWTPCTTTFRLVGTLLDYPNPQDGDICVTNNDDVYLFYGKEWHKMDNYDKYTNTRADIEICDKYINTRADIETHPKICSRCGAPLLSCKCDYCGTMYV